MTLTRRLAGRFTVAILAILAILGFVLDRVVQRAFLDDLTSALTRQAATLQHALPAEPAHLQEKVRSLGRELDLRITVIRTDGEVVGDSSRPTTAGIENHATRPEVRAALTGEVGVATRLSETVGEPFRYVALPPRMDLVVRVALPLVVVESRLASVRAVVGVGFVAAALAGLMVVWLVARSITRPVARMTSAVSRLSASGTRVPEDGIAELALLARTLNAMADDLESRIEQIGDDRRLRDAILSAMDEGVILIHGDGIAYANAAARRMLGDVPANVGHMTPFQVPALIEEARTRSTTVSGGLDLDAGRQLVQASAVPLTDGDRVLLVLRDVTEARRVEAMRRDFVASASHELKTPAASIQAGAETLHRAIDDDPQAARRFAVQLERDAVRLSRLVADLLDLSRLEADERDDPQELRLDHIAGEEVERLRSRAAEAQVELTVTAAPVRITGWPKDLGTLVRNLLDNSIRYTPPGGRVRVDVGIEGRRAILVVSDTGVGIPSRDLPRIFERFYRVDPARSRATGGTGLGLAIAKHIAEQHGGSITATSELGRGSSFTVTLSSAGEVAPTEPPPRQQE